MPRTIVIDKTVIDQLNSDNKELANFFNSLRSVNLIIINDPHLEMMESEYLKLNEAGRRLCDDMKVRRIENATHFIGWLRHRTGASLRYVEQIDPDAFKNIAPEHEATIAIAFGDELLTFDKKLAETYARLTAPLGGKVVPELKNIPVSNKPINYFLARRNLGLQALNIAPSTGAILPTPKPMSVKIPTDGPLTRGGARTTRNITAQVGERLEPVQEHGPSASGDAKFQGAVLVIKGVNYVLQKINGAIQARRFNEKWDRLKAGVEQRLNDDPQLGAMLFVYYSQGQGDIESAIDSVTVFDSIEVGYGFSPDDAEREFKSRGHRITPGQGNVGDTIWIKPQAPMDINRLKLPFGTTVAGLATFVAGKEKLVRVKFAGVSGFDDKLSSRETLNVAAGMTPRFYYLWPPKEIRYHNLGRVRTVEVGWTISDDADESVADLGPARKTYKGIPVVKLDSFINPSTWFSHGATAAMVWPADNRTANLFQTAGATGDNNNFLAGQGIGMMRWIRPEFIRVLKDPI